MRENTPGSGTRFVLAVAIALSLSVHANATRAQVGNAGSLTQQHLDAALAAYAEAATNYRAGRATLADVARWAGRVYWARRDAGATGAVLVAAAQEWVDQMRAYDQSVQALVASHNVNVVAGHEAAFYRLEAEMELARATKETSRSTTSRP